MSSASASRPIEGADGREAPSGRFGRSRRFWRFGRLWRFGGLLRFGRRGRVLTARGAVGHRVALRPHSLFGRLFFSVLAAVFLAQALTFTLVARERNRFITETNVREWSRRIVDVTYAWELLAPSERAAARARFEQWPPRRLFRFRVAPFREGLAAAGPASSAREAAANSVPIASSNFRQALATELVRLLGPEYGVTVKPTANLSDPAITVSRQPPQGFEAGGRLYDVRVTLPDRDSLTFRVSQGRRGPLFPWGLQLNLALLTLATAIVLYVVARGITRPLSRLARAAEAMGRDMRQPPLEESGAQELKEAARAFNTMQDRMHRYLDSRTRVLAAMSHDLKTPLTRMRLRVETLVDDEDVRERFGRDLDEMQAMVYGTLALLKGLSDDEAAVSVDVDALLATLVAEFAEVGEHVEVQGETRGAFRGRPQALKRCLTNLLSNAVKFGGRARVLVEDGAALILRVDDEGPGLPVEELERVFEPFYRVESSRNRDTGGTGLGLAIARDIAQAHGGSLVLRNLPAGGLEAILSLPRVRPADRLKLPHN